MISVVIPVYNEERDIESCLQSLSKQTIPLEVIVVDDGSNDRSKVKSQKAKVLSQHHQGPGAARNLGARHARGDILVFMDADMTFAPDCIEKLVTPIIRGETIGTFSKDERVANWQNPWARAWNWNEGWPPKRRIPADYPDEAMVFRAIKRRAFARAGGFDEDVGYTDDWSLSQKLGVKSKAVADASIYHRNPDTLLEVYTSAAWIGRDVRHRRKFLSLIRFSLPVSLVIGMTKAMLYREPAFVLFKIVYDLAMWWSVVGSFFRKKSAK